MEEFTVTHFFKQKWLEDTEQYLLTTYANIWYKSNYDD